MPNQTRDGADGTLLTNITSAQEEWFKAVSEGDLHLKSQAIETVINMGTLLSGLNDEYGGNLRPTTVKSVDIGGR